MMELHVFTCADKKWFKLETKVEDNIRTELANNWHTKRSTPPPPHPTQVTLLPPFKTIPPSLPPLSQSKLINA